MESENGKLKAFAKLCREHQSHIWILQAGLQVQDMRGHGFFSSADRIYTIGYPGVWRSTPGRAMEEVMWPGEEPRTIFRSPASSLALLCFVQSWVRMMDT